jgi:hypothetical protein
MWDFLELPRVHLRLFEGKVEEKQGKVNAKL